MTWETIPMRGGSVSVSWRKPGGAGAGRQLCLTLSSGLCDAIGLRPGGLVVAQRDRMAGRLRLVVTAEKCDGARKPRWRSTKAANCAMIWVPLKDVALDADKPAQTVRFDVAEGMVTLSLPPWACPPVRVYGGRPAIPLRDGKAA